MPTTSILIYLDGTIVGHDQRTIEMLSGDKFEGMSPPTNILEIVS